MSEPGDFLNRWSRRKRAAAERGSEEHPSPSASDAPVGSPLHSAVSETSEAFDITQLPPIESIQADTDISLFLKPGVPAALRHAALRRVWVSDPAIRDFRAPQEMDWDFESGEVPGFGAISPDFDVKRMAARILGDVAPEKFEQDENLSAASEATASIPVEADRAPLKLSKSLDHHESREGANAAVPRSDGDIALQHDEPSSTVTPARKHGGAMPH